MTAGRGGRPGTAPRLLPAAAVVFLLAVLAAVPGLAVRATYGAHLDVDEPQYLLTAISLAEDRSLDISDELAEERWRDFADRAPSVQTAIRADGRQVSPHDPLLPLLLAVPVALGSWVAAKVALALLAGLSAVLTLVLAVRAFAVPMPLAAAGVGLAAASPPLAVYATQVYPEMPAALCVVVAALALSGRLRRRGVLALGAAVVALPWLGLKYVPVAAVLAVLALLRLLRAGRRTAVAAFAVGLVVAGGGYLAAHRLLWGGWTAYAAGDHFVQSGEFGVVGFAPDYPGRSLRLVGLLVDRGFGLVPWQPAWLLVVPAAAALLARRGPGTAVLLAPLAAGWAVATWVALTMHGYWWPGRQLVVVLPLALVTVLVWLHGLGRAWLARLAAAGAVLGVLGYAALLRDGLARRLTWVVDAEHVGNPAYAVLRPFLPDYRAGGWSAYGALHLAWSALLVTLAVAAWRTAQAPRRSAPSAPRGARPRPTMRR